MDEIITTAKTLMWFLTGIVTLGGAVGVILKFLKPFKDLQNRVEKLEQNSDNDFDRIGKLETGQEHIYKGVLALIDHSLDGNSTTKLKQAKDEMQDYLIRR